MTKNISSLSWTKSAQKWAGQIHWRPTGAKKWAGRGRIASAVYAVLVVLCDC